MSCVILTETHIGQDHTVVEDIHPHRTTVNMDYPKIFIPPHRRFLFATVGAYKPERINTEEFYSILEKMINDVIEAKTKPDKFKELSLSEKDFNIYDTAVDNDSTSLAITRSYRFVIVKLGKKQRITSVDCGPIVGLGTGGGYAEGLIRGGMSIDDIWPMVHKLDKLSSAEHSIVSLDTLSPWENES